jgi:serine protease
MAPGGAAESRRPNDVITSTSNTGIQGPVTDTYIQSTGTSFAAPMVASVASLMLAVNPNLTPAQLIGLLQQSARPFPSDPNYPTCSYGISTACNCTPQWCGAGLLDANAAVQLVANPNSGGSSGSDNGGSPTSGSTTSDSQGGGGTTGWFWGLGLWSLAAVALWQRHRAMIHFPQV